MEITILANFISSILSRHSAKKLQAGRTEATTLLIGCLLGIFILFRYPPNEASVCLSITLSNIILQTVLYEFALKGHYFPGIGQYARCPGMSGWIALKGHHKFIVPVTIHTIFKPPLHPLTIQCLINRIGMLNE